MRILIGFLIGILLTLGGVFAYYQFIPATSALPGMAAVPDATTITLSVNERQSVKQDLMIASLRFEARGDTVEAVQANINTTVQKALEIVKAEPTVKLSTEAYSVYVNQRIEQATDADTGKVTQTTKQDWMGSQTLVLQGTDAEKVQNLAGQLQGMGFAANNIGYSLSPEKAESLRESLMKGAVAKMQAQADQAARLLGKKGYVIREIAVDGGLPQPMPMYKAMRMEAAMASDAPAPAPSAEPGETDVNLTLNARVELKD